MHCLILGVKKHLSKAICDKLGLQVSNCDSLAVCTLSGESSITLGQAIVQMKAVDSRDNSTLAIENVKVVENLKITTTRAKDLSKWPHLKDLEIPNVHDEQVTTLIGTNVPEAQVHEECRRGGQENRTLFALYWVGLCLDQLMLQILRAPKRRM